MSPEVKLSMVNQSIAVVTLEDREHHNTFSKPIIEGLINVFDNIKKDKTIKVVIIQGYENYFCCGGTQEELLNICSGKITFADLAFYRLLLDCEIPTIAAMQGHAIGGGLAFGCYADFLILAEESIYSANFMKYGFTPGMGATYMIPKKFGEIIGNEMLFSGRNYQGSSLKKRGSPLEIAKRENVLPVAIELAEELANKPRLTLSILKEHMTKEIRINLPQVIEKELWMHQTTFAQPEVKQRIIELFNS